MDLAKLALTGLIGGLALTACDSQTEAPAEPTAVEKPAEPAPTAAEPAAAEARYMDVHSCAGLNTCKGLGGCKVTAEKLASLAEKAGTPMAEAGEPHSCKGLNACKGLGGCGVDEATFAELKAAVEAAEKAAPAEGTEAGGEEKEG